MDRSLLRNLDLGLIVPAFVLVILSLATLLSLNPEFFKSQAFFAGLSVIALVFFSQVNHRVMRFYGLPIYVISIILLLIVLVVGIESRGATRWIEIFGNRIQFSEVLKPFLVISLATFLSTRKNTSFFNLILSFLFLIPIFILIFLQPDLGNALIYAGVLVLTLVFFGFPIRYFLGGAALFALTLPFMWNLLHEYQRQRVLTFINPSSDPLGTSYNAIQSIIAVGSGMLMGKGLGQGTQSGLRFLPERHTDFIFATISEQFGFIGGVLILASFGFILYRIFVIYENSNDSFSKIFAGGSFFLILVQFFVNVGMNIGLLPVVGVTLPFVSYGGSSLLSSFILLGLLSSIEKSEKEDVLEIR